MGPGPGFRPVGGREALYEKMKVPKPKKLREVPGTSAPFSAVPSPAFSISSVLSMRQDRSFFSS